MNNGWHKLDDFEETRQIRVSDPRPSQVVINKPEPKPEPKSFPWYLITGLVLGFLLGLLYAWWVNPVVYSNTEPATLRADFKDNYRLTIAQAYAASGDLDRAESRLALLQDEDANLHPRFASPTSAGSRILGGCTGISFISLCTAGRIRNPRPNRCALTIETGSH